MHGSAVICRKPCPPGFCDPPLIANRLNKSQRGQPFHGIPKAVADGGTGDVQ